MTITVAPARRMRRIRIEQRRARGCLRPPCAAAAMQCSMAWYLYEFARAVFATLAQALASDVTAAGWMLADQLARPNVVTLDA